MIGKSKSKIFIETSARLMQDALKFPLIGSAVLVGLFALFKFLPKDLVNAVLTAYFVILGTFAITAATLPVMEAMLPLRLQSRSFEVKQMRIPYLIKVMPGCYSKALSQETRHDLSAHSALCMYLQSRMVLWSRFAICMRRIPLMSR